MKHFYRVQNSKGQGPYAYGGEWAHLLGFSHEDNETHPGLLQDPGLSQQAYMPREEFRKFRFGFRDMEQLEKWFTPSEIASLASYGFEIVEIEREACSEIYESDFQLIYKKAG